MSGRVAHRGLRSKIMSASEAAAHIEAGHNVGMSGFTPQPPRCSSLAAADRQQDGGALAGHLAAIRDIAATAGVLR